MKKLIHGLAYAAVALGAYQFGTHQNLPPAESETPSAEPALSNPQRLENAAPLLPNEDPGQSAARTSLSDLFETPDYNARWAALKEYFKDLDSENAHLFLAEIEALPPGPKTNGIMRQFFSSWGKSDGLAAFEYAKNLRGRDRLGYLSAAAAGWAETQPIEAWGAVMDISNNGSMYGISTYNVLNAISKDDLQLAVDLSLEIKDDRRRASHFSSLVRDVSFHGNYEELFEIANTLENPHDKSSLVKDIFETWGRYETDAPNQLMATISDPTISRYAVEGLMGGWAAVDGAGAFAYAIENRDQPGMEESLESIAKTWARSVTANEMENMMSQVSTADSSSKLMQSMIHEVARANPQLAMDWATNTPDESARANAVSATMSSWARSNINDAENYYHSMTDDKLRSRSAYSIARGLASKEANQDRILALLDGFEDPKVRGGALITVTMAVSQNRSTPTPLIETLKAMVEADPNIKQKLKDSVLNR
ncbi:hypothetical protein [Pelagicoccus sp. SDUM812005]|uniref:hypothetical protein n=1 Tax=Pelagicoccus sp. SDUM812005 TaxID=3041257 RepID=UPI00280FAF8F|nr:hypothetical protein [Pelagicoccus sp. SDUM812005]MDQ8181591.1 hypothetical protein [Pelagicoccus sp. SDUM812005]